MATKIDFDAEKRPSAKPLTARSLRGESEAARLRAARADAPDEPPARYPGFVRVGIALGGGAACWALIAGLIAALG